MKEEFCIHFTTSSIIFLSANTTKFFYFFVHFDQTQRRDIVGQSKNRRTKPAFTDGGASFLRPAYTDKGDEAPFATSRDKARVPPEAERKKGILKV